MASPKSDLYHLVADLSGFGYGPSCIAKAVGRSPERIGQILLELGLRRPRIRHPDDLPEYLRQRCQAYRENDKDFGNRNESSSQPAAGTNSIATHEGIE